MAQQPLYRRGRSTRLLVVALVTASLVTITVDYRGGDSGPLAVAGRATLSVISPLQETMSNLLRPVGNFFSTLSNLGSLRSENRRLSTEISELLTGQGDVLSLRSRVEQLEKLLGIAGSLENIPFRTGRIQAESVSNLEWAVTINLGSADGIRRGMPVVAPEGLIGHVVKVTRGTSDVQLILDVDSSVGARLSVSGEEGLIEGRGDEQLIMSLVDADTEVLPNERVETSGFTIGDRGSLYPPHIPIGRVNRVVPNPADLEKQVWIEPYVDFTTLQYVMVLITPET